MFPKLGRLMCPAATHDELQHFTRSLLLALLLGAGFFLGLGHLLRQDLLHTLLLFKEERAQDSSAHAASATRSTVSTADPFLAFYKPAVLNWAQAMEANQRHTTISTMGALGGFLE